MKNILVAIAQMKDAEKLVKQAVKIAEYTQAKLWIIHVAEPDPDSFIGREAGPQFVYDQRAKERQEETVFIDQLVKDIKEQHNIDAQGILIQGAVAKVIKKEVDALNIDLVIAGHRKKDFLYRLFTADNKSDLINELDIPLLAVPLG